MWIQYMPASAAVFPKTGNGETVFADISTHGRSLRTSMLQLLLATGGAAPHPGPHRIPLKKVVTARHELKAHPIADPDAMVEAWPSTAAG